MHYALQEPMSYVELGYGMSGQATGNSELFLGAGAHLYLTYDNSKTPSCDSFL